MAKKSIYLTYLGNAKYHRMCALAFALIARDEKDETRAQEFDHAFAENMAKSVYYLDKARKLRIKERIYYGNQL